MVSEMTYGIPYMHMCIWVFHTWGSLFPTLNSASRNSVTRLSVCLSVRPDFDHLSGAHFSDMLQPLDSPFGPSVPWVRPIEPTFQIPIFSFEKCLKYLKMRKRFVRYLLPGFCKEPLQTWQAGRAIRGERLPPIKSWS